MNDTQRSDDSKPAADTGITQLDDELITTRHTLATDDGELAYTARSGRVVLWQEKTEDDAFRGRRARAQVAIPAYTLDGADPTQRPVTFAFNGGPGSSSVWLHIGLLGPRRVVSGEDGALEPPPYRLTDNLENLLAHADLGFIDPVYTG